MVAGRMVEGVWRELVEGCRVLVEGCRELVAECRMSELLH